MLIFIVLALAFVASQQVTAELQGTFIHDVPNPTVDPNYIPGMPNPLSCPKFPIAPYHYPCYCNLSDCLSPQIEAAAENLNENTLFLSLCDIQQMFLLLENVCYGLDPNTEIQIVKMIIYALEAEIRNGGYIPTIPPYCDQYSDLDPFTPSSLFSSEYAMGFYNARMQYMLDKTMPPLSDQLEATLRQIIETYLRGVYEFDEFELFYKFYFCLRGILANMIDTTPYVL